MNATEILLAARAKVEAGWCCIDSLKTVLAAFSVKEREKAKGFLLAAIGLPSMWKFCIWYQHPERTLPEVLSAFDRAVELSKK